MNYIQTSQVLPLPFAVSQLLYQALDVNADGAWLAVSKSWRGLRLRTAVTDAPLRLKLHYASVRWLDDKALVVASRIQSPGDINAWVIDPRNGNILTSFSVGDGVNDVVVLEDFIAVSYFDEGVYGDNPLSNEGVSIFDRNGLFQWGYTSEIADSALIDDCYAICKIGPNAISFCAYSDFTLVELNLTTRQHKVTAIPGQLHGCGAITTLQDKTIFHGPHPEDRNFRLERTRTFALDKADKTITKLGNISGKVSSLSGGRMLAITETEAMIIHFSAPSDTQAAAI
jgi:hypothetical protein